MNIGFVSTRFSGTDGVSLEATKWAEVLQEMGHHCFWFSGLNDRPSEISRVVPQAYFGDAAIEEINASIWQTGPLPAQIRERIASLLNHFKEEISDFVSSFSIDLLLPENAVTIPMNVPLGLAGK